MRSDNRRRRGCFAPAEPPAGIEVRDLIGKPFEDLAQGPSAYDCFYLMREVLRRFGHDVPDYKGMATIDSANSAFAVAPDDWLRIDEKEPGCAVTFLMDGGLVSHVGVMLQGDSFIHCFQRTGVVVERLSHPLWKNRVAGFHRFIGAGSLRDEENTNGK